MTSSSNSKRKDFLPVFAILGVVMLGMLTVPLIKHFVADSPFADSPTNFTQTGPVRLAASGSSIIFKSPGESNNCPLRGGEVRFVATPRIGVPVPLRLSYKLSTATPRNDVVSLVTPAGALTLTGLGEYRLTTKHNDAAWRPLTTLAPNGAKLQTNDRGELSIMSASSGHYLVRALDAKNAEVFRGIMIPGGGKIYIRSAVLSPQVASFLGHSEHDCGNWDSAAEADKALQRVEARTPS
jgi:hypothetical protein